MSTQSEIKRIFIDGQRKSLGTMRRFVEFEKAEDYYTKLGYKVFNSITADCKLVIMEHRELKQSEKIAYHLQQIAACDALVLLAGWETDFNIRIKIAFCVSQGIPILEAFTNRYILAEVDLNPNVEYHTILSNSVLTRERLN